MAKSIFSAAAAALALSGAASAISFNSSSAALGATAYSGTGSLASATSSPAASATPAGKVYCPAYNGQFVVGPLDISYKIECDTSHLGVLIDIDVQKRAVPNSLEDCLNLCSGLAECLGAAYDTTDPMCYLFSSIGAPYSKSGFSFAEKASALNAASSTSSGVGAVVTSFPGSNNGTVNGTSPANSTSPLENLFCPQLDSQIYTDSDHVSYIIECGRNHVGDVIGVALAKRAAATSILNCMAQCDANTACVAVGYNTAAATCTLFSEVGAAYYDPNVDFAIKVADTAAAAAGGASTTLANGAVVPLTTSTVYTTTLSTVLSCAPTVTNCPLRGSVVTDVVALYTTVCPATEGGAIAAVATGAANGIAAPIACTSCPYAAVTATVYSTTESTIYSCPATVTNCPLTMNGGSTSPATVTSMVAAGTTVVNYPLPVSTFGSSAPVVASTATAVPVGPHATTSGGLVSFTGAAVALQAGMGMVGAAVAGAAFLL